jgi:hypothetical protein
MRKISEALRLKWACGLSKRAIGRSCQISHSTVSEYLKRAEAAGLKWPLPEGLDEDSLYRLLFPEMVAGRQAIQVLPDWEEVHRELKKRNVTLRLLWTEYRETHPEGYGYSQYCDLYRRYARNYSPEPSDILGMATSTGLHQTHRYYATSPPKQLASAASEVKLDLIGYVTAKMPFSFPSWRKITRIHTNSRVSALIRFPST